MRTDLVAKTFPVVVKLELFRSVSCSDTVSRDITPLRSVDPDIWKELLAMEKVD